MSSKTSKKYYVVWVGKVPGIYGSWDTCKAQITGFPGAKYKSFKNLCLASSAYEGKSAPMPAEVENAPGGMALAVDAACNGSGGTDASRGEHRGVLLPSGREVFKRGPWGYATNNIMEFLAIIQGMRWMCDKGIRIPLFSDSKTAAVWVREGGVCRTTKPPPAGTNLQAEIYRAESWLKAVDAKDREELIALISKWDTERFGEIPADFGRK